MAAFDTQAIAGMFALIGVVILVAGLLSGFIQRSNLPQVAVFLGIGAALGPLGFGAFDIALESPALRIVATLSLALVLFTDALRLNWREVRRHLGLTTLILGPGTLLSAALIAAAAHYILRLPIPAAAILGAALASTDPVLLRGLMSWSGLPGSTKLALRLESGLNDVVLLPVIVIAMAFLHDPSPELGPIALALFVYGPGAGIIVGLISVGLLVLLRRRLGMRRDYESIYSLGVAFVAFGAAEMVHGSGFLAAFAAGATIAALDVELCDCFVEYGETTAELLMLFTFVLLGASLIWLGFNHLNPATLVFVLVALAARPLVLSLALVRSQIGRRPKALLAWFGPRGLSSLLLILVPVFEGMRGSGQLFEVATLVVVISIVIHGGSITFLGSRTHRDERAPAEFDEPVVTVAELDQLRAQGERVLLLDSRTDATFDAAEMSELGAVRVDPLNPLADAIRLKLEKGAILAAYCT